MSANPLAGLADVMTKLAGAFSVKPLVSPIPTYTPNRAQRRRAKIKAPVPSAKTRGDMRRRAQQAGYAAGKAGLDHKDPGVCPYTNRVLIDAWSAGYVDGRRKRKAYA